MRILVADCDKRVARFVKKGLASEQYAVDVTQEADETLYMAQEFDFDLAILDLALSKGDGLKVLSQLRAKKPSLPVLILSARNNVEDRVKALDLGADDYLAKPFSFCELSARVRALLRRTPRPNEVTLKVADLEMNRADRIVKRRERRIDLTPKEFALLEYLMRNAGRCVTRAMIAEHVWDLSFETGTNVVDVYISYLRKKVDAGFAHRLIHTIHGMGYELREKD